MSHNYLHYLAGENCAVNLHQKNRNVQLIWLKLCLHLQMSFMIANIAESIFRIYFHKSVKNLNLSWI